MKMTSVKFMALGWLVITAVALTSFINNKHNTTPDNKGFAVVELFTSEGCSSCPPADAVVAKIEKESTDRPIYILAFHVDYWNRLGWKDVFSSAAYSDRQRQYAEWLRLSSVYTPQVVVNGNKEFVGSEEGTLRNTIKADLQKSAEAQVSLDNIKVDGNKVNLQYKADGNITNSTLLIAVIEKAATSKVERGENEGRTLSHVQIVRSFANVPVKANGSAAINLPNGFDARNYELIAFVQNTSTGAINGATKSAFPLTCN
jgi:hypothetical protein